MDERSGRGKVLFLLVEALRLGGRRLLAAQTNAFSDPSLLVFAQKEDHLEGVANISVEHHPVRVAAG